jgi:hypothetical protein
MRARNWLAYGGPALTVICLAAAGSSSSKSSSSGETTTASATTVTPTTTISVAALQSQLLMLSDMPAGWSVGNSPTEGSIKGCDTRVLASLPNKAKAAFQGGASGFPANQETILGYASGQETKTDYARVVNYFNACKTFTITSEGKTYSRSVGAMSLG